MRPASTRRKADYQGQICRLRTGDGIHFTKFGARKLALYVEREIERSLSRVPVALPVPADPGPRTTKGKPSAPVRPEAGPVVPLTGMGATTGSQELREEAASGRR